MQIMQIGSLTMHETKMYSPESDSNGKIDLGGVIK